MTYNGQQTKLTMSPAISIRLSTVLLLDYIIFFCIQNWLTEVSELAKQDVNIMLLGNKLDMESSREVSEEDGKKIAQVI